MKKVLFVLPIVLFVLVAFAFAAEKQKMEFKVGDEQYVCNCGDACPCKTISMNAGKCACGKDMVKATVTKVEKGKAMFKSAGWDKERAFPTVAKYKCACGPDCKCNTISQNPGNCTCGKKMNKV